MAATFLQHGWEVIGTVRDLSSHTPLHDGQDASLRLRRRRSTSAMKPSWPRCRRRFPASLDMLFVNAGTTNRDPSQTIGDVSTEEFTGDAHKRPAPMRVIERLQQAVKPQGCSA